VGSALDITDLKLAEEALALKNEQLIRINNDLDNFVYAASHDLRSPITNIEALTVLLKEELTEANILNANTEDVLRRVSDSVDRFKRTISDLTEISRLQKNLNDGLREENVNIPEVYGEIILDLNQINRQACSIQTDFQVDQLTFSRKNFRSIVYNLLSNAIKYRAPDRDCSISIETKQEGAHLILRVKDNGLGMNERQQEQLYTMFKRFHNHVDGTGIGLFMVKRIVENAGGKIKVESEAGVGTEFRVYFNANK
jgi:signal transduction histidine kinase